jgi:hypothetical protein
VADGFIALEYLLTRKSHRGFEFRTNHSQDTQPIWSPHMKVVHQSLDFLINCGYIRAKVSTLSLSCPESRHYDAIVVVADVAARAFDP